MRQRIKQLNLVQKIASIRRLGVSFQDHRVTGDYVDSLQHLTVHTCQMYSEYEYSSFAVSGPTLWNSLPLTVRDPSLSPSHHPFCTAYQTSL